MNKATEIAQRILDEQGYLVMAFGGGGKPMPRVGDVLFDNLQADEYGVVPGPFIVRDVATGEEFIMQLVKFFDEDECYARRMASYALGFFRIVAE